MHRRLLLVALVLMLSACDSVGPAASDHHDAPIAAAKTPRESHAVGLPIDGTRLETLRRAHDLLASTLEAGDPGAIRGAIHVVEVAVSGILQPRQANAIHAAALSALQTNPGLSGMAQGEIVGWLKDAGPTQLGHVLSALGPLAPDPCSENCGENFLFNMIAIEVAYLGTVALCPATGPLVVVCWGVATTSKAASVLATGVSYNNCLDNCD